jgi:hypothetical protein
MKIGIGHMELLLKPRPGGDLINACRTTNLDNFKNKTGKFQMAFLSSSYRKTAKNAIRTSKEKITGKKFFPPQIF